jgi:isoleucyl-tRNA synthetase
MPETEGDKGVHLKNFMVLPATWDNPDLAATWEELLALRRQVLKELEEARQAKTIGNSLEAAVILRARGRAAELLSLYRDQLADIFIVSRVELTELEAGAEGGGENPDLVVTVQIAAGEKCARCWCYREKLTPAEAEFPGICKRCLEQLQN